MFIIFENHHHLYINSIYFEDTQKPSVLQFVTCLSNAAEGLSNLNKNRKRYGKQRMIVYCKFHIEHDISQC